MKKFRFLIYSSCFSIFCCYCLKVSNLAQALPLSSLPLAEKKTLERSPLGDYLNVEVFDFIVKELFERKTLSQEEVKKILKEEIKILKSKESLKSYEADIVETPFSHILNALCAYNKKCQAVCVYKKDGVAIGITSINNNFDKIKGKESYAVLSDNPLSKVGLKLINKSGNTKYYEAIQVVYLENNIAHLSLQKELTANQNLVGFMRYIFTN